MTRLILFIGILVVFCQAKSKSRYSILVRTGTGDWAGTDANIYIKLYGDSGNSDYIQLSNEAFKFERGSNNYETVDVGKDIGTIQSIKIMHDNTGSSPGWLLKEVTVTQLGGLTKSVFIINRWLQDKRPSTTAVRVTKETDECGRKMSSRIISGDEALPNSWPWMVQIGKTGARKPHHCGGTLIHPEWVLTAAHCVYSHQNPKGYHLTLGEHTLMKYDYTEQRSDGSKIIVHPSYSPSHYEYDIALIKLEKPAQINSYVKLACIPHQNAPTKNGKNCYITGWGREDINGKTPLKLRQAALPKVPSDVCENVMWNIKKIYITSNMLCAGGNMKSGCRGDSGGPLNCLNDRRRYEVHGVVSWGSPTCAVTQAYSVFARVSMFSDWIKTNIYSEYVSSTRD